MLNRDSEVVPIDEESILINIKNKDEEGQPEKVSILPSESNSGLLHRFRSYFYSTSRNASLPVYHQKNSGQKSRKNLDTQIEGIDIMSTFPKTDGDENWEPYSGSNKTDHKTTVNSTSHSPGYDRLNYARTDQFIPVDSLSPLPTTQQQPQSNRRKWAGKVKAARRRVFKNRHASKVDVLGGQEEVVLSRDIRNKTPEDIFRTNPLDQDAARIMNGGSSLGSSNNGNGFRRSLQRILSNRSMPVTGDIRDSHAEDASSTCEFVTTTGDDADWPVRSVEAIARNIAMLFGAYVLGASRPEWSETISRLLEFIVTAWVTCLVILGLGWLRKLNLRGRVLSLKEDHQPNYVSQYEDYQRQLQEQQRQQDPRETNSSERTPLVYNQEQEGNGVYGTASTADHQCATNTKECSNSNELSLCANSQIYAAAQMPAKIDGERTSSFDTDISLRKTHAHKENYQEIEHPKLVSFYVIDACTGERIMCNGSTPFRISNEWVEMDMLAMIRTSDTDDPNAPRGTATNDKISEHFRGKQRRFEFQYRVKVKKVPVGKQLYFSCELDDPIKMGIVTKAFVSAAMAFVRKTNPTFHYNITGSKTETGDGKYETPHMSFTVEAGLDRFVVTKPGETPPELGSHIHEDPESIKKRKSGKLMDWNTEDTYTMAIWSSYVDFLDWKVLNLPGIKPFGLGSVLGTQSINLTMYLIDADVDGDNHYRKDITEIIKLELSNGKQAGIGKEAKKWIDTKAALESRQNGVMLASPTQSIGRSRNRILSEDSIASLPHNGSKGVDENMISTKPSLEIIETIDEMEEIDIDAADAAELGEGIYLRSGDSVVLKEFLSEDEKSTACAVINGGGFAVLSKRNVPIVIEKAKRSKKSTLIKSGDTVMFKMFQNKAGTDDMETRYLTIHRGWWLKWVTTMPSKNGFFTIFTHETELGERALPTDETQSSFLTLGGSFTLRHKRWSRYAVGVSSEPSTDFGGRMLSLYNSKRNKGGPPEEERNQAAYQSEDEGDIDREMPSIGESGWIKPLVLCTQEPQASIATSPKPQRKLNRFDDNNAYKVEPQTPNGRKLIFSNDHSRADVPAWIEMMDREQRVRQLAYVVRIFHRNPTGDGPATAKEEPFIRLKSGKDLARIMSIGQRIEIPHVAPKTKTIESSFDGPDFPAIPSSNTDDSILNENINMNMSIEDDEEIFSKKSISSENLGGYDSCDGPDDGTDEDEATAPRKEENDDFILEDGSVEDSMSESSFSSSSDTEAEVQKKSRLRKVKKLAKKTVVKTGRKTKKTAGKVVKTTGKKLRPTVSLKPGKQPRAEPKRRNKESQTGVSKRMKKLGKIEAKSGRPPIFVAGELSATEQSRRTASRVLERMSSVPTQSSAWQKCNEALSSEFGYLTVQDTWFLDGDAMHLGVKPSRNHGKLLGESVVARCIWESHWREEWCGMYESAISFYAPLARSACHEIFYSDITRVRSLDADSLCPLPGFSLLVIETAWQCHYVAFRDETSRNEFAENLENTIQNYKAKERTGSLEVNELQKARFWQGFQTLSETSLVAGPAKWAKVSVNQKSKERAILNGRRMAFDSLTMSFSGSLSKVYKFVEDLLTTALTFSFTTLEQDPGSFIDFLDQTTELRFLPLGEIDLSSPHAFCMFVNIYHCLLQQALLLSVNGPLHKKSVAHFMRTSCYEIGGDVFSLAELHSCVICGKMTKPINPKPPYIEAPKKSNAYKYYALKYTDIRVHFVLNTADMACPPAVQVLSQRYIEQQLSAACVDFFCNRQLFVDTKRRIITLPKVCEIRKNDFGKDLILHLLRICMDEMDNELGNSIRAVLEKGEKGLTFKYQHTQEQYHSSLRLTTTATNRNLEMEYRGIAESHSMD